MTKEPLDCEDAEFVLGYFVASSRLRAANVYVTTRRIIINKRPWSLDLRVHILTALLIALAPFLPGPEAILVLIVVAVMIAYSLLKRRALRKTPWPSVPQILAGPRLFEVEKGLVLSIELKKPSRIGTGSLSITSLLGEKFQVRVIRGRTFRVASNLTRRFEPDKIRLPD